MNHPRRHLGTAASFLACSLAAVILAGCTDGSSPSSDPTTPKPSETATGQSREAVDKKLGQQAEAALDTITPGDPEFLESGLERLSDGIHRESLLTGGKSYQLSVACAGSGNARLSVQIKGKPAVQKLDCDGTAAHMRIQEAPSKIKIDVDAVSKASGMVAWRIAKVIK